MPWYVRLMLVVTGLYLAVYGSHQLSTGQFAYLNRTYRQPVFAPGAIALGCLFIVLSFLPSASWVSRRISTRRTRKPLEAGSNRKTRRLVARRHKRDIRG